MLKFLYSQVYTSEIPRELSLGIVVLGCDVHCPECHSPHTWDINCGEEGILLTKEKLDELIESQKYISCILFYGGEWKLGYLTELCSYLYQKYDYALALYSGRNLNFFLHTPILNLLTYLKVGPYIPERGGLIYPSTNQHLFHLKNGKVKEDITHLFWRTRI